MKKLLLGLFFLGSVTTFAQQVSSLGFNKKEVTLDLNGEVSNALTINKSDLEYGRLSIYANKASFSQLIHIYSHEGFSMGYPAWEMTTKESSSEAFQLDYRHIELTDEVEEIILDIWSLQKGLTRDPEGEIKDLSEIQDFELVVTFESEKVGPFLPVDMIKPFYYSFKLNLETNDIDQVDSIGKLRVPIKILNK